ncbi:2'-deoxycytidine 5'-triphosphate deaminase [Sporichthya polymorpha]|uniref:2'-deoxycytidine 5'-triphosphate deaminase n=1 Tax=Sporichthya polymorpha TaxID=35751 RepID=UPI00036999BB|nr:2'-deoxycytidine 5'-triphosphate deaminase [Sporichthya polymorpha]
MAVLQLPTGEGVLPDQFLRAAIAEGVIDAGRFTIPATNIQPASLDLRLGEVAYRIRCSFLPHRDTVEHGLKDLIVDELDLRREGVVLETGRPYLIPLKEALSLPPGIRGKANPKSSTGRADVFTRVITDGSDRFDEIAPGYSGQLYLEVVPLSFPIRVREDLTLNQLRLAVGRAELSDAELQEYHGIEPILFADGAPVPAEQLVLGNGMFLGLDLRANNVGRVGYRARPNAPLLDLSRVGEADPEQFWEPVKPEPGNRIVLTPKDFYLLMSYEAVRIPSGLAAEMTAYDPTSGELRTHYAGFFDPGFGVDPAGALTGSTAALEVRAHDVPFMIEHRQGVCKLTFERMLAEPERLYGQGIGSNYQNQVETLGKHFRLPTTG